MDEISRAITLAFIAVISALLTQILLRWDQTRRDTRLRLLEGIRIEQAHFERVAYKARHLLLSQIKDGNTKSLARIDEVLFGDVYRESSLVTLCAELDSYGIPSKEYSVRAHKFRRACLDVVTKALDENGPEEPSNAVEEIKAEIEKMSTQTKRMAKNIHHRFSWL
ncbi:MAG: hypothetical protein JXQ79_02275 [Rhodobacteraceae bacterium]|nr:hypothetical protein [Paracoccaceae bacterium]